MEEDRYEGRARELERHMSATKPRLMRAGENEATL